eukprot:NODE_18181_length_906_cov_4.115533.p2 GENE.NODE_18181_length_906_cov_4.115533~~NODE_18181_length_906_cov_4.115533.p2  ORF type:complete len:141 (-),score=41.33 NODE_18181_length_906_cov_4.115533:32-454(-)
MALHNHLGDGLQVVIDLGAPHGGVCIDASRPALADALAARGVPWQAVEEFFCCEVKRRSLAGMFFAYVPFTAHTWAQRLCGLRRRGCSAKRRRARRLEGKELVAANDHASWRKRKKKKKKKKHPAQTILHKTYNTPTHKE